jgi:FixJ family two-component response regulator
VGVGGSLRGVLVVEDDEGMRESIESLLHEAGFNPMVYASAEAMLAAAAPETSLCVVSDLRLPALSGFDLLTELRQRGWQQPVIVITAYDSPSSRQEAERRGAAAYLAKPFPGGALLSLIEDFSARASRA